MTDVAEQAPAPALLAEGTFAVYATPEGGRVITFWHAQTGDLPVLIPAELVQAWPAALESLRANPGLLATLLGGPVGMMARRAMKQAGKASNGDS